MDRRRLRSGSPGRRVSSLGSASGGCSEPMPRRCAPMGRSPMRPSPACGHTPDGTHDDGRALMGFLDGYRVLDLTDARGLLAGRLLADLGADVVAAEPTTGSPARHRTAVMGR